MVLGIDPKVDYAFKRVFGDERNADILIHLLNAILRLADPIVYVEILNPFDEKNFLEDKLSVLDLKVRDQAGRLLDVEMQLVLPPHFSPRVLYYWAGLYRQQLGAGDKYDRLRPAISICLLNQVMFPEVHDYHLAFGLFNREHNVCFTDHIQVHLLELPKFRRPPESLRDDQERWLYFFRHAEAMDSGQLPRAFRAPIYQRAFKELEMLTKDELERERYEARLKAIRDEENWQNELEKVQKAIREAEQEAREAQREAREAQQEAREASERGALMGQIHLSQRFLKRPLTPQEELATLPLEELRRRAAELEAEMFGG